MPTKNTLRFARCFFVYTINSHIKHMRRITNIRKYMRIKCNFPLPQVFPLSRSLTA